MRAATPTGAAPLSGGEGVAGRGELPTAVSSLKSHAKNRSRRVGFPDQGEKQEQTTKVADEDHAYEARLIRRIGHNPRKILGVFRKGSEGGRVVPIDKGTSKEWMVALAVFKS